MNSVPVAQTHSLVEALERRARDGGGEVAFTWLEQGERIGARLTFAQLDAQARAVAARLQAVCAAGDRVLLAYPPGLEYVAAFFGCLYAGLVAVPALPPANAKTLPRLLGMLHDARPRVALSTPETAQRMRELTREDARWPRELQWLSVDGADEADAAAWKRPAVAGEDIAFLQYTSGSTGAPKGVMVTHANLLANAQAIGQTYGVGAGDVFLSWLPPHHDFGLIGSIATPVVLGGHCVQFAPAAFLMRPHRWLKAISDWRAKITGGPNFAYALCVEKVTEAQKQGLDLSCLQVAVNGAERVRAATLRDFADAFAGCGLRPNVVTPSYGLAESTLLVSASRQPRADAIAATRTLQREGLAPIELVGAGEAAAGSEVVIVDAQADTAQPVGTVGEIWVRGPSVAAGYWGRAEETEQVFGARLAGGAQRYLRTGDLGFLDEQGHLYVTGRLKEMMIFNGENVYPQDVEVTVEAQDAAFRANGCAAFSLDEESGRARLVLVQELETRGKPDTEALVGKLRLALYERHGITELAAVLLVKAGQLPRTSSGKIQRVQCRRMFQDGAFQPVWAWHEGDAAAQATDAADYVAPATPTEAALAQIWQELLGVDSVSVEADFLALGGHSLLAGQIAGQVREQLGVELELQALFEAPTVRGLARRIDELVQSAVPSPQPSPSGRGSREGKDAPLSFAQKRLWFLDQYTPGDAANNIAVAVQLTGPLQVPALEAALNGVVARHEALRTRFGRDTAGEPVQIIEKQLHIALPVQDVAPMDAQAFAAAEALAPFDLRQGPLLRARLLRQGAGDHLLLVTVHHIVSDGWSMGVLAREVSALYAAHVQGQAAPLAPLAIQYADYAAWQRQWLQGPVLQRQLDYWRVQLADAPSLLTLPTDRPRPQVRSQAGASLPFALDAPTTGALRALCQAQGATLFMGLLAGFSLLLARSSGQHDVSVGTFAANRTRAEVEPLIGFFLNTLVLRTQLEPGDSFTALLRRVRDTTLQAYAHQHLPFEQLLEAVRPERDTSYTPLFQAMLVLQNLPDMALSLPGVQGRTLPLATVGAKTDLMLELWEQPGAGLTGRLEFSTDLFDEDTIERLGARLRRLLRALAERPAAAVASHDLLDATEHRQLLAWNATQRDYPRDIPTAQWFEQQAQARPDATALVFQDQRLSYGELDARANRLAHWLRARGVGPDVLVGLCMPRGMQVVVAVLGILKAGGAYLPLDPDYPPERLGFMLDDARPALVITQQALRDRLPPHGLPVLDPDAQAAELAALPDSAPPVAAGPGNLAYVIYTSGSTGKPKGVAIAQRNLNAQAAALGRHYGITAEDRMLQFAALSFDMSVEEIFGALLHGAALVLRDDSWLAGPSAFATLCERNGVTLANLPTGFWRLLVNAPEFRLPACVRQVMVGGEAALPADMQAWFARFAHAGLLNSYGPTEATVNATSQRPTADPASWTSIGGPIGNTRIHVLDAQLNPVPVGIAGEIYIGGEGIARGYLGRAALTAERFVPEPFTATAGARMYRTGDLGRWRPDGTIEFLGRVDHQVKIRGFRIELGEIEAALAAQPGVREALVLARTDTPGNARLVAYAAAQAGQALSVAQLRAGLAQSLPDYMVPALFVLLPAFPLLPNGKVDRKALPAPDMDALASEAYEAPVGVREEAIAAAWAQALGLPRVGRHDNFFALGGHSLLAVGLVEALRRQGIATGLRSLFMFPTVAGLAAQGQEQQQSGPVPELPPMAGLRQEQIDSIAATVPGGLANIQDIYPLAPLQEGILFHHRMGGEGDVYLLRSVMAFDGRAHLDRFLGALQTVIDRHDVLRSALRWEGLPRPVQVVQREARLPVTELPAEAWDPATPEGEPPRALLDAADPARVRLDLRRAPLLATWVLESDTGPCWLALLIHHTVSDHVTVQLVLREVRLLLQGDAKQLPAPLPYRDFVAQALAVPDSVHEAYFRELLGDVDEPTAPFGVLDVHGGDGIVTEARLALPDTLAQSVRALARRHGMTPAVLFHLAWAQVVARTSGRDDVVFGTLLMGRSHGTAGADRMLGLFINTLPLRLTLAGRSVAEALAQAQQRLGELVAHEQAPLALAQRASGVAAPAPLFSSLMNFRHGANQDGRIGWAGMRVASYEERTNYPLALAVDDLGNLAGGFALTAHVQGMPVEPQRICAYMATAMENLVALLEQAPHTPVREIEVLPAQELHRQLVEWNASAAPYPRESTVVQQFEQQARLDGGAVAVVFEGDRLTRSELNARANTLAHHLRAQGVGPDVLVGVCMEPGIDLIAGLLAVLKAGGAYLPLDPAYPAERLAHMLEDARPAVVLTTTPVRPELVEGLIPAGASTSSARTGATVLCLDRDAAAWLAQPDTDLAPSGGPDNLAYVIYTSGSTGKPKGVAVPRHAVMNVLAHIRRVPGPLPEGPASLWASISFDPAVQEIFTALTTGAPLHVVPQALRGDPERLVRWLAEHRIVQGFLPPAIVRWATEAPRRFAGLHLRRLATGVESLFEEGLWTLQQLLPGLRIEDGYGPTEATLYASSYTEMRPLRRAVPIGRPVSNAKLYVLDAALRPVPAGVAGEVFIAGAGLARGYLKRPDLTAERFLPDPFGAPGTRMYRTGDLAHHLPDGNLVFAGRADQQVKIRGFRVELGEIEAQLTAQPQVAQALAVAREDGAGERQLVAYVVPRDGQAVEVQVLRAALARTLPGYMVPSHVVVVDAFPLTPNGKIDRKALPAPDAAQAQGVYVAPRTRLENNLAAVWAEVLGLERVGLHDNFFELGGHSLLATRVVSQVGATLGIELPLRELFNRPRLEDLAAYLESRDSGAVASIGVAPRPAEGLPLSHAQQRLWFLQELEHHGASYNIPMALRLQGEGVAVQLLADVFNALVERHETLRTVFRASDGQPRQMVLPRLQLEVGYEDLGGLDDTARYAQALIDAEATRPFDLAEGPLLRVGLLRLAPQEHIVLFTLHHIVSDGWSMGVLVGELVEIFKARLQGTRAELEPLPIQYADYAVWQREHLRGDRLQQQLRYWQRQLQGAPALLELPTDRPRPAVQSHRGATYRFELSQALVGRLRALGQAQGATLFMVLHSAFTVLLHRYSGQDDISVGTPIAGRNRAELEGLIGFFVNTLVLRSRIDPRARFDELLAQSREVALGAYAHQELPFEQLVEELRPQRSLSHSPLFQVMFALQNAPRRRLEIPGLEFELLALQAQAARFDLTCNLTEEGEGLQGSLDYNADLFDEATMARLAGHYEVLLAGICDAPHTKVQDLPLLTLVERQQLLVDWNATAAPYRHGTLVHELFEERAARMPDATALVDAHVFLTYAELNARANQLARRLRAMGVGPEQLVGICMQRGHELVVGLLAVLKAGGAYVPLDADYPRERLRYMLGDAQPVVLLTTSAVRPELVEGMVPSVLCLDRDWSSQVAGQATGNLATLALPHNLAYVIYTSGSTGQPKGVGVTGRSLAHIVSNWCRSRGALPGEAASLWSSISFDASVHELFVPLATGGALHVVPQELRGDPAALMHWMREHRIAQAFLPPAFVRWLIERPERLAGLQLKQLATGVEPLPEDGLWRLEQALPGLRIANGYGPTEATIYATEYTSMQPLHRQCPVGRPIANNRLYLLDAALQPVPIGITGEVFIAGDGLARGYLGRPQLTAERFVPDPFGPSGTRMYRTGDLARHLADGNLQFAGRADHQVKVRGFRIEPGEVEAQLLAHPQIAEALVIARADSLGENQLVAYVVPREAQAADVEALRATLGRALPQHMVPSHIVPLAALPLNANGKIDRDALPAPQAVRGETGYVAPRTPIEQELAAIWQDVLGVERVGIHDNFFSLGGHSLLATQAISRLRARFAEDMPLQALFEEPTVAGMAGRIAQLRALAPQADAATARPPLVRVPRDQPLALSFAQQRLWFLQELEPGNPFYNMPVAVRMRGALDVAALQATLDEVMRRHETLRTRFVTLDGTAYQQVVPQQALPLAREDLRGAPHARVLERMQQEAYAPFDLVAGPPVRARLVRLDAAEHLVLLTVHHIVSDGWSMGVLLREIGALYAAFAQGAPSPLPELPIQYADFAQWQRQVLSGEVLERQVAYWKNQLAGAPELLALPTDRPRPPVQSHRGDTLDFEIAPTVANGLREIALRSEGTLFMPLTAALNALLARYSSQRDICIGTAIANRTRGELEPLIGFFVNTLVLRTRLEDDPGFEELVGQVRRTALEAYAHQDIPFEHLVDVLAPERHLDRTPLFQVMLVLQNAPMGTLALPDLTLDFEPVHSKTAKCDLTFFFAEDGERIEAHIEYSTDLFDQGTIELMSRHFLALLDAAVAQPRARVSQLPLMDAAEQRAVLAAGEGERFAVDGTLHGLLEAQARRTPNAVALVHGQQRLSYAQLDAKANQLAHKLRGLGVGPEVLVGICVERGLDMVVGLLGILKAGGAYVPLDPAYPAARLAYMLEDAKPAVLLTTDSVHPELVEGPVLASTASTGSGQASSARTAVVVCLDRDWDAQVAALPTTPPPNLAQPQNLAYMIYTSGSTGQPKGTQIPHRAVVNLLATMAHSPGMQADDVLLAVTSLSFDIAALELFLPLAKGASIVIASREQAADASALADLMQAHRATMMQATPSTWRMLQSSEAAIQLRLALCGGEAMDAPLSRYLCGIAAAAWNVYGPTETTVWSSRDRLGADKPVTLGRPIGNTQVCILDEQLNLVPQGVAGELHIGGTGLARGYLHRPALTAEKFIANPHGEAGSRLYKTGDLARYLPDGSIEYLGRIDQQVKLRGFRIELGEIEAVLRSLPIVREAAVAMRGDVPGEERLVAYVATNNQADEAAKELEAEQSGHWSRIWEQIYGESSAPQDSTFNIAGWNSSFDRQPIPANEMEEWVDDTVGRIQALRPRKVLEIGCGTGLLLHRIAPGCERYWGMDFSATVLEQLRASLDAHPVPSDVRLLHREANDVKDLGQAFDTVVINSVAQYFPNLDYLTQVLEGAIRSVGASGRVFVGDVRNFRLFDAFNVSLVLHGARPSDPVKQVRRFAAARQKIETELLVDPAYFFALKQRFPQVTGLKLLPKLGQAENELTKFRYDAVIEVGEPVEQAAALDWRSWDAFPEGLASIDKLLAADKPQSLAIHGIPDARVEEEIAAAECLHALDDTAKVGELRTRLRSLPTTGVHAGALARLCERHGYQLQASLAGDGRHAFHAVISVRPMAVDWSALHARLAAADAPQPLSNRPVSAHFEGLVRQNILSQVQRQLPAYMVPAHIVLLDALPLTPNGKLDRKALPAPELRRGEADYVAPRTPAEEALARIWAEVLGLDRVGIHDNFFELGGHSLLATRVISRIRTQLGAELPLRALFEASSVAELAARIAEAGSGRAVVPIVPVPRDRAVPLSYAQNRFWFLEQYQPGVLSFSMPVALTLSGEWDGRRLARAFDALVARHEPLRTTFSQRAGVPEQVIAAPSPLQLRVEDCGAMPPDDAQAAVDAAMRQEAATPFDLAAGPLWRVRLLKVGAAEHVLLLTLHHILYDAWSLRVLIEEMMQLYRGEPLPALPVHYADYCHWERTQLGGPLLQEQLGYWRGELAGAPDLLPLPTDRPRPATMTYAGRIHRAALSPVLTQRLTALATASRATLFMVMAAAFKALLHRLSGQQDLALGNLTANRGHGTESLIGIFANIVVLRSTVDADSSFADVLDATARQVLAAHDHPLPFELVLTHLVDSRDPSYMPYAQVVLNFYDELEGTLDAFGADEGLRIAGRPNSLGAQADFQLKVDMRVERGGLAVDYIYNTDLFDEATVARWHGHLEQLAEAAASRPQARIAQLPLMDAAAQRAILAVCNDARHYDVDGTLHGLFEAQAARRPDAVALTHEGRSLSYGELNRRANRLAHYLRSRGVQPDVLVGLCAERSIDMVVGMLAILKAGGGYLPLDPDYPAQRLAGMVADAKPVLVLTTSTVRPELVSAVHPAVRPELVEGPLRAGASTGSARTEARALTEPSSQVFRLDRDWDSLSDLPDMNPPASSQARHLAYVIYTSGSTGKPKGALLQHGNVLRLLEATAQFNFSERDVWTFFHSFAFDFSVWEIWGALLFGGRVVIVPDAVRRSPPAFLELLSKEGVTVLNQTPSAFYQLVEADGQQNLPLALRSVIFGGERLEFTRLKPWYARHEATKPQLVNMYGITETTVHVTYYEVTPDDMDKTASIIGRPIGDLRAYVLDPWLQPVPTGVTGELYVAGAGLARGYLGRPELTAERFILNPHGAPGERMYKTGDAARLLPDGTLEYLGRLDEQVKVRGYRIELGEIEAALAAIPGVKQALVVAREDRPGDKRLVAYAVCEPEARDAAALRTALQRTLPHYMLPSHLVLLDSLPLTPNGKIDKKALPAPDADGEERAYVAPRTPTQEAVAAIWAEVLQLPRVGAQDNFFELGGHSLLATQVVARLRETLGVELSLRTLFQAPDLAALGAEVDAARRDGAGLAMPPLTVQKRPARLPLSYAQERLWLLEQIESMGSAYNITGAVRFSGTLDVDAFERALAEIVRRHEALRTRFDADDETIAQVIDRPGRFALERIDLSGLAPAARDAEATRATHKAAARRFDLAAGRLFHATLLRLAPEEHLAVVVMHHIVSDGWSLGVLIGELGALYTAFVQGRESPLPELPVQYADYALWQRGWLQGEALQRQVDHWKQRLHGAPVSLDLPLDHPRPPVQSFRGARVPLELPKPLVRELLALARAEGATLFMVLLAAFQHLLARWSGQQDIVIGTPVAGRTDQRTEGLIGFFVNMLVLRTDVSGEPSFRTLLTRAKETALEAYAHQDLPFEKLVEELNPVRDLSRPPIFQVMINSFLAENQPAGLDLPGLRTEFPSSEEVAARFELMLRLMGEGDDVALQFEYATDLFDEDTIERFAAHYRALLELAAAQPDRPLDTVTLLADEERRLVEACSRPAVAADAVVVTQWADGDAALDAASNRIARHLAAQGVQRETVVGLVMQDAPDTLAAVLGILKSGAACLPLDPADPPQRRQDLLAEAGASLVLDLAQDAQRIAIQAGTPLDVSVDPSQTACLLRTSDSAGAPVLALLTHHGLARRLGDGGLQALLALLSGMAQDGEEDLAPYGRPGIDTRAYVLDPLLQPVPPGVYGELVVGGDWARGYAGRPEATARDFIASPFVSGERLVRTGELARWRMDGSLELPERSRRAALQGRRIEFAEIEAALTSHPAIAEAAVLVHADDQGRRQLIGYVVPQAGATEELAAGWHDTLAQRLPAHMLPDVVLPLAQLPRTPRGGIAWKALPAPGMAAAEYIAPRTPEEQSLAAIWSEVLGVERVGVQDNFFALGGHSLLATLMVARLREVFGVDLPLRTLFETRTLEALARLIANLQWTGAEPPGQGQDANDDEEMGVI